MKLATAFEPQDVALMGNACDRAWRILQTALLRPSADYEKSIRTRMARRVLEAVEGGVGMGGSCTGGIT